MRTVRARLTLFTILVVAAILTIMGGFLRYRARVNLIGEIDRQLFAETQSAKVTPFQKGVEFWDYRDFAVPPPGGFPKEERLVEVLRSHQSEVRLESQWSPPRLVPVVNGRPEKPIRQADDPVGIQRALSYGRLFRDFEKNGQPMRSLSATLEQNGKVMAVVQATRPMGPVLGQLQDLDRALAMSIPVALLLAAVGGAVLVGSSMRPLRRMTDSARRLEDDLASSRLPVDGADEFAELAATINTAFDRTAAAFVSQSRALAQLERFTGDAGHELRTPLASIKTNASYLLHMTDLPTEHRASVRSIDVSADRMSRLIGDLLLLARQDAARRPLHRVEIDVHDLVRSVVENLPPTEGIDVQIHVSSGLTVYADLDAVERVLVNLISNALHYARHRVDILAVLDGSDLVVKVKDDGEGIAPENISRLGERFYRPDESRSRDHGGAGLGLAIARSLTESHGGNLIIESQLDQGTTAQGRFKVQK